MIHRSAPCAPLVAGWLLLLPVQGSAQELEPRSWMIPIDKDENSTSFRVRLTDSDTVRLDLLHEVPLERTDIREDIPEHRDVFIPLDPDVDPNRIGISAYTAPEVAFSDEMTAGVAIIRNVVALPTGVSANQVAEPTVATKGDTLFYTANHFAAFSTDGGQRFTYVDPEGAFSGTGYHFCCDQVVSYIPLINMYVWSLQAQDFEIQRILYATPADMVEGEWSAFSLTPDNLGVPGADLDFTDMSWGSNMLYWSTNVFQDDSAWSVAVRIPLDGLQNGNPQPTAVERRFGVRLAQNTGATGYFAAHYNTSTLRVYSWDEGAADPTYRDVEVPKYNMTWAWQNVGSRVLGATRSGEELWFAWNAGSRGDRPLSYVQVARINASDFTLIGSPDIWSNDYRVGIPALATIGQVNEVGVAYTFARSHSHAVGILTGTPAHATVAEGGIDAADRRWGDYVSVRQHYTGTSPPQPAGQLAATGYTYDSNGRIRPRFVLFGRSVEGGGR